MGLEADCLDCLNWKRENKLRATTKSRGNVRGDIADTVNKRWELSWLKGLSLIASFLIRNIAPGIKHLKCAYHTYLKYSLLGQNE